MLRILVTAAFSLAASTAMAQGMKMPHAGGASPSDKGYAAAMDRMMGSMHARPTGDPDRDFVTMMIPHHQGAIDMAQVELQYGKDPQILALARAVVDAQAKEIAEMQAWLKAHPK